MATIAIVSQKGGSGKTTLAINLATCAAIGGKLACIVDTDPQASAASWGDWRGDFQPEVITCPPVRLTRTIQSARQNGIELVVIDTPPHADAAVREAVKAADLVLVPVRPRAFDLQAIEATAELIAHTGKPAYVVLNSVPARATKVIADASAFIEGLGVQVCPVRFGERAAFHQSASAGQVASEAAPDGKAAGEAEALWQWVCGELGIKPSA
jgi:chromosome partitioning protein